MGHPERPPHRRRDGQPPRQRELRVRNLGWRVQGGGIFTVPTNVPGFGERSLMLRTTGLAADEGVLDAGCREGWPDVALHRLARRPGRRRAGQRLDLGVQRSRAGHPSRRAACRAHAEVAQFAVKTTVTDPAVTHIRVLVRTSTTQKATVFADLATLRRVTAPAALTTHDVTTYNSDGAILSPTILPDGLRLWRQPIELRRERAERPGQRRLRSRARSAGCRRTISRPTPSTVHSVQAARS